MGGVRGGGSEGWGVCDVSQLLWHEQSDNSVACLCECVTGCLKVKM